MKYTQSNKLRRYSHALIPGGAHTYSKGDDQFPEKSPGFIVRGKGAYVWDPDGNKFLDWAMGLRSTTLGHGYIPVVNAAKK
ncbi:MAG: Aminotransferase class-III, partial [Candidatus Nomurabacteria bacterium GW2011_GWB1_47_6]